MNDPKFPATDPAGMTREEILSAVFAQMVMQQANIALMMLGKVPHPQTGQTLRDLDAAQMFIDQLEMLEAKTKGNLSKDEQQLLKQSLMSLRMAFVEAVESPEPETKPDPEIPASTPAVEPAKDKPTADPTAAAEEESKKKFSKKY